ncbi:nucleolar complex protein 3 homolog [Tubulanus polymorphus]|uniref:nucleolar complex protein 3 homolog n=1 Tax=Tubulanus polymorphus TaxID=672921 RepID=UPI003DA33F19
MVAKKGGRKGNAKKSGKASATKINNKRLNKLAKRGKLKAKNVGKLTREEKQEISRKALNQSRAEERQQDVVIEEIPLLDDDYKYFGTPGATNLGFLGADKWRKSEERKANKRKIEENLEENYENVPRKRFTDDKKVRHLLPIKTKAGIIPQVEEIEDPEPEGEDDEGTNENSIVEEEKSEPLPVLSTMQLYAIRQRKLAEKKQQMAILASGITENPEENVRKLKDLRTMLYETDVDVMITMRKYVMLTLSEVFKDIIPDYKIRPISDTEKVQSQKKETKSLREYEAGLLTNYRLYLQFLEAMITGKLPKKIKHENKALFEVHLPAEAQCGLAEVATNCMCSVLIQHPHFNYRTNIINTIVPLLNHNNSKISDVVSEAVKTIFKEDKTGNVSLEIVRAVTKFIKMKSYSVKIKVLKVFMSLKIKKVDFTADQSKKKKLTHKEKLKQLSRRERKKMKQKASLEKELEDAAAAENVNEKVKLHTQIVETVFLAYFRILKKAPRSVLLSTVLEGLAKFAHLINIEFFSDLFNVLNSLIESGDLTLKQMLHCIQTAFIILTGQGSALTIDPLHFYTHLYDSLLKIDSAQSDELVLIILECLDLMLIKRKKQVTQKRALGYIKRLTGIVLQQNSHSAIGLLASIRSVLHAYPRSDLLFDTETQGSGIYQPELVEPEHCNAQNTALYELHLAKHYYHPIVQLYGNHLIKQAPLSGQGQLPPELLRRSSIDLYNSYDPNIVSNLFVKKKGNKKKQKRPTQLIQADFKTLMDAVNLEIAADDIQVDFSRVLTNKEPILNGNSLET